MRQLLAQLKIIQRQKAKKKEAKDKKAASRMAKQVREDGGRVSVWLVFGRALTYSLSCVFTIFSTELCFAHSLICVCLPIVCPSNCILVSDSFVLSLGYRWIPMDT